MSPSRDASFRQAAVDLGYDFDGEIRIGVYVQSAGTFTQQSEVADGASAILHAVLGPAAAHARTSIDVHQRPKNATVEVNLVAAIA